MVRLVFRISGTREDTEGISRRYERTLRHRAAGELEEERDEFRTKNCTVINETNICELDAKRDPRRYEENVN